MGFGHWLPHGPQKVLIVTIAGEKEHGIFDNSWPAFFQSRYYFGRHQAVSAIIGIATDQCHFAAILRVWIYPDPFPSTRCSAFYLFGHLRSCLVLFYLQTFARFAGLTLKRS